MAQSRVIYGVDFSSAPSSKKPITVAVGLLQTARDRVAPNNQHVFTMQRVLALPCLPAFDDFLSTEGPWIGGFDLPFSLPRPLIEHYGWPDQWSEFIDWYGQQSRADLRLAFKAFCDARPIGNKFVYRKTDRPAGSSPAMRWTNPPVAWMLHAGAPRLKAAGICLPGLYRGRDPAGQVRLGFEAYPGFTARQVTRASYKSDDPAKQTIERRTARRKIITALCGGQAGLPVRLQLTDHWRRRLIDDGSGDLMDAAICALQAATAVTLPDYGFPADLDTLEGWIASVPATPPNTVC
jgi:hypothetical protein